MYTSRLNISISGENRSTLDIGQYSNLDMNAVLNEFGIRAI